MGLIRDEGIGQVIREVIGHAPAFKSENVAGRWTALGKEEFLVGGRHPIGRNTTLTEGSTMNKRQLIDDIRQHNTTVAPQFLAQFDEGALKEYLDHLQASKRKHVTLARIVRPRPTAVAA